MYKRIYKIHTLEPLTKNFNKLSMTGTSIDPCFRYRDGQGWQQSSPQSPKPYSLSHTLCKSKKIFSRCLTLLQKFQYFWRSVKKKSTSHSCRITSECSESAQERRIALYKSNHHHHLVETIVALTLNIPKWYFWMTLADDDAYNCGFDLEHTKMIFLNDTLADDDASQY